MKQRVRFSPCWACIAVLMASIGLGVAPARAANPIAMDVASPLAITDRPLLVQAKFRRWFPIAVTLSNRGDAVSGTVSLRMVADGGAPGPMSTYSTKVDLPTNSNKRIWLYGRYERGEITGAEVSFAGPGVETLAARFPIRTPNSGTRTVLTISDSDEKLTYLSGFTSAKLGLLDEIREEERALSGGSGAASAPVLLNNQRWVQPLGKTHEWIPSRWIGLEAVDAVVLQDFPYALSPEQLSALRGYVASGGQLIVLGGADWQRLANAPLADLWPITPTSSAPASSEEVADLARDYVLKANRSAADRLGGAPVVVTRGALKADAQLLMGSAETPLIARRAFGAGEVLWLGFDPTKPPFLGWGGLGEMWADVFRYAPRAARLQSVDARYSLPNFAPGETNTYNNGYNNGYNYNSGYNNGGALEPTTSLWSEMVRSPQLRTPPVSYIAWFLALYVFCLVPLNYVLLRSFDKRELAWISVPIIVIAFSVFSYSAALKIKGTIVRTRQVNIVQGSAGAPVARADAMLWLFSPRRGYYTINSPEAQMVVDTYMDGTRDGDNGAPDVIQPADASFVVRDSLINMWDYNTYTGHAVVPMGKGLEVRMEGATPRIVNNSPHNLRGVVLVANGQVRAYGDVGSGQSTLKPIASENGSNDPSQIGAIERASQLDRIFPNADTSYDNMAKAALRVALGADWGKAKRDSWLIGWSDRPATPLVAQGEDPQAQSVSLFVFRLPSSVKLSGGKVKMSSDPEASVRVVETSNPNSNGRNVVGPQLQSVIYQATFFDALPAKDAGHISINANLTSTMGNGNSIYNRRTNRYEIVKPKDIKAALRLEVWDWQRSAWQKLSPLSSASSGNSLWNLRASLPLSKRVEWLRPSASELRLRLTAPLTVQVNAMRVSVR